MPHLHRRDGARLCAVLLVAALAGGRPAWARPEWPFAADGDEEVQEARSQRERLNFFAASGHLDRALELDPHLEPKVVHERGLIARDRGDLERALSQLARAAELDPRLAARVDQAGVLVQVGRWPEAINVLRQAFEERGPSLPVEQVTGDRRFVRLATLAPYQALVKAVQEEQSGPLGRTLVRLERLQTSVTALEQAGQHLQAGWALLRAVATSPATATCALVLVTLACAAAIALLGLFRPPWPLIFGALAADLLWMWALDPVGSGRTQGWATLARGNGLLAAVGVGLMLVRLGWRRLRLARVGPSDPLLADHLPDTLLLVDEVSRLGHRLTGARKRDQRPLVEALRAAAETLRERLDKGVQP